MSNKRHYLGLMMWSFLLLAAWIVFEFLPFELDLHIQDLFYNFEEHHWLVPREQMVFRSIFYYGMKYIVILVGVSALFAMFFPAKWLKKTRLPYGNQRRAVAAVFLSIALIPSFIGYLKHVTDVYFPSEIERYDGDKPYFGVFEGYPEGLERAETDRGGGYPAGHASGGFALFSLVYIVAARNRRKVWWWAFVYGSLMALYQTVNGAHYFSHTLVTICITQIFIILIGLCLRLDPFPPNRETA